MKITQSQLRQIIKEELARVLKENERAAARKVQDLATDIAFDRAEYPDSDELKWGLSNIKAKLTGGAKTEFGRLMKFTPEEERDWQSWRKYSREGKKYPKDMSDEEVFGQMIDAGYGQKRQRREDEEEARLADREAEKERRARAWRRAERARQDAEYEEKLASAPPPPKISTLTKDPPASPGREWWRSMSESDTKKLKEYVLKNIRSGK